MDEWHAVVSHQSKAEWMHVRQTLRWCHTRTNLSHKRNSINRASSGRVRVYRTGTVSSPTLMIRNSCWQVRPGHGRDGSVLTCEGHGKKYQQKCLCLPRPAPLPSFFPSHRSSASFSRLTMPARHFILTGGISLYQEGKWDCIEKQWEFDSLGDYFELVTGLLSNNLLNTQI